MDTSDLLKLITAHEDDELTVKPNGMLVDSRGEEYDPAEAARLASHYAERLTSLLAVIRWAKTAPEYTLAKVTVTAVCPA